MVFVSSRISGKRSFRVRWRIGRRIESQRDSGAVQDTSLLKGLDGSRWRAEGEEREVVVGLSFKDERGEDEQEVLGFGAGGIDLAED